MIFLFLGLKRITAGPAAIGVEPTRNSAVRRLGSSSRLLAVNLVSLSKDMDSDSHNHRLKVVANKQIAALPLSVGPVFQQKKRIATDHMIPKEAAIKS